MALHVRGVVLPDDEVRDLWLVGDRVTLEPVAGAETIADGGFILPGLVDAHCHLGIAPGGAADRERSTRRGQLAGARPGRRRARHPRRRLAVPVSRSWTTTPTCRGWPARAGTSPRRSGTCATSASRSARRTLAADGRASRPAAGNGWVKLVGDWIDRDAGDLAPAWDAADDGRGGRGRARGRRPGRGAHVRRGGGRGAGAGRRRLGRARHRAVRSTTSTRWPGAARPWSPR